MFRVLALLTIALSLFSPAIAQYSGLDTTAKIATYSTSTQDKPQPANHFTLKTILNPIQKEAMTFMLTNNANRLVDSIAIGLQNSLETNFGNVGPTQLTRKPTTIGYQYHFRDRWTMGVKYSWATVTSDTLAYPDFDLPGNYAYFQYVVKLNSFLASIDYAWKIKNTSKSAYALYSGIALGNSRIDYNTVRMDYDKSNSYIPAFNGGVDMSGFQVTLLGIKQHFRGLRNFGYHAELGVGINSIGFAYGLSYTL
jgi:hypothetical protein